MKTTSIARYFSNTVWLVGGRVFQMGVNLVAGIFVARYLGPKDYGLVNYVISFCTLFACFASLGLDNILLKNLALNPDKKNEILGSAFVLRLLASVSTILLIGIVLWIAGTDRKTALLILVYSLNFIFLSFWIIRFYFESQVQSKYGVLPEIQKAILGVAIKGFLIIIKADLFWFIVCWLVESVFLAASLGYYYRRQGFRIRKWRVRGVVIKDLLRDSYPLMLSGMAIIIYQQIDRVMLKNMLNVESVGYYSVALNFCKLVFFIPLLISRSVTPALINAKKKSEELYNKRFQLFSDFQLWFSLLISLGVFLAAPLLVKGLYGASYIPAIAILQVAAWKGVFMAVGASSGQWIVIEGRQKYVYLRNLVGCLVNILLNYLWIPKWGAVGSAWATVIALAISAFLMNGIIPSFRPAFIQQVRSIIFGFGNGIRLGLNMIKTRQLPQL